jgi:hypothetical protein
VYWDGHTWQPIYALGAGNDISFLYQPSGLTYQPAAAPPGQPGPAYRLVPSSTQHPLGLSKALQSTLYSPELAPPDQQGPEVSFRTLTPLHVAETNRPPYASAYYETQFTGQFSSTSISAQFSNPLNWLPETTYAAQPVQLRYDAQGRPVSPTSLLPTTNPAGFMLQPPVALTTLAALLAALFGATPILIVVIWTLPAILLIGLISVLYPLRQIWRIRPAEALRAGAAVTPGSFVAWRLRLGSLLPPLVALSLSILMRLRVRVLIAIGSIFFSALLLTIMFSGLLAFRQTLQGTLLGNYVLFQTQIPQIAGAVFAVLLTFLSVADLLLLQVRERQQEIGLLRAVGWRPVFVQRLFIQEGLILALCGALPGVLVALLVLAEQHTAQGVIPAPLIALGSLLAMVIIGCLATIPAIRMADRMQVVEVLRAE